MNMITPCSKPSFHLNIPGLNLFTLWVKRLVARGKQAAAKNDPFALACKRRHNASCSIDARDHGGAIPRLADLR